LLLLLLQALLLLVASRLPSLLVLGSRLLRCRFRL
jgi:hypothetical protein